MDEEITKFCKKHNLDYEEVKALVLKARWKETKEIGKEFKKWFNGKEFYEDIEDAIFRITGVKC